MEPIFCFDTERTRYGQIVIQSMQEVLAHAKSEANTVGDLEKGIWYAEDYCNALHRWGQNRRIQWFQTNQIFDKGFANPKYFDRKPGSGLHFIVKKTISATQALQAAITGVGIYDCGMVCQIARYRALEHILGTEKFNRLFDSHVEGARLNIGYLEDDHLQPMRLFIDFPTKERAEKALLEGTLHTMQQLEDLPVQLGQLAYVHGTPEYPKKHAHGPAGAFNLFCSQETKGEQKFLGFGLDPKSVSAKSVYDRLSAEHNRPQNFQKLMTERDFRDLQAMREQHGFIQYDSHTSDYVLGFMPDSVQDFKIALIWKLVHTPIDKIQPALLVNYP